VASAISSLKICDLLIAAELDPGPCAVALRVAEKKDKSYVCSSSYYYCELFTKSIFNILFELTFEDSKS